MAISSNRLLLNRYLHFWLFYVYSFATGGMYNFLFITVYYCRETTTSTSTTGAGQDEQIT